MGSSGPPILVVMGVSGCGKSTIAALLAAELGWDVAEGDDLHPAANVAKMAAGHPLDDDDRRPWLEAVGRWIQQHVDTGRPGIITCSALKRAYRDQLRGPQVTFVYLHGTREQIASRLAHRRGHYMPATLLDSQFADLEPPGDDERALWVDTGPTPAAQVAQIVDALGRPGLTDGDSHSEAAG
jgi:carbohydrate kinase (thermoresistant glucokinase family)